jgi:hypothetical protein
MYLCNLGNFQKEIPYVINFQKNTYLKGWFMYKYIPEEGIKPQNPSFETDLV